MTDEDRAFPTALLDAAVAAADPERALDAQLPARPKGRTVVIGAGKGAAHPVPDAAGLAAAAAFFASARLSLEAAADRAQALGVPAVILSDAIEAEARDVGRVHAAFAALFVPGPTGTNVNDFRAILVC